MRLQAMTLNNMPLVVAMAFAAIYVLWGSTYLALAVALEAFPPFLVMGTRSLAGGATLLAIAGLTGGSTGTSKSWIVAAVCGLFFFVGCHGVLAYAQQHVPSGLAAVFLATIPFWIMLLAFVVPGSDRPSIRTMGLLVPGLAGVALIAWKETASAGLRASDILLLLGASASWAVGTVVSKWEPDPVSPLSFAGMQLITGGLALLFICAALGEPRSLNLSKIAFPSLAAWGYLTIAGTVVAFVAYTWLLKQVDASLVATYTFVNPIIAVLLGWAFLGEKPTVWMIAGATLVIIAVGALLFTQRKPHARRRDPSNERIPLAATAAADG
jgi:drug/metabolite transporter (DMT)-like permease